MNNFSANIGGGDDAFNTFFSETGATGARLQAALAFVSLYTIPTKSHAVPVSTRLEPAY